MLARRGKTRSRKPREGHVSPHEWLVEKRYAMTNFLAIFHVCDTNISNFPTNATRFINIYLRGILTLKKKEIGRWIGGKSVKRFTTKPPYTCTRITPRFTVIKYRVSSPSGIPTKGILVVGSGYWYCARGTNDSTVNMNINITSPTHPYLSPLRTIIRS